MKRFKTRMPIFQIHKEANTGHWSEEEHILFVEGKVRFNYRFTKAWERLESYKQVSDYPHTSTDSHARSKVFH